MRILALAALLLILPTQAEAFPGERLANNPTLNELVALGQDFWHARGVQPCGTPTVMLAEDFGIVGPNGETAAAIAIGCTIWFNSNERYSPIGYVQAHPLNRYASAELCATVIHELGHTAGLEHSSDPRSVMAAVGGDPPWACRVWARSRRCSGRACTRSTRRTDRAVASQARATCSPN